MQLPIETKDLTKVYGGRFSRGKQVVALDNVSVSVGGGQILALLGPNGAGKTTLTKILLDLVRPTSGKVFVFGEPPSSPDWKRKVGYLPEVFRAPASSTAAKILRYLGMLSGLRGRMLRDKIDEMLHVVDLESAATQKVGTYSKGMMLRLGIAQALLHDPELVFLDEPTEGLDPIGRKTIRNLLLQLRSRGTTILLNSHLLSEVELVADRVAILNKGNLVADGALAEILPQDVTYRVEVLSKPAEAGSYEFQPSGSSWICEVQGAGKLQEVLSSLAVQGTPVSSVKPIRTTLEDIFLSYVGAARE